MSISLHSRLVAAMPRYPSDLLKAFDLDDIVQRRRSGRGSGGGRQGAQGLVVRTYRGILEGSEDDDPDSMNPEAHEVQVAWEDGAVENVARDQLELVDRPFYAGDLVVSNKDGKTLGLIVEVEQTASVRLVPSPELQPSSGETGGPAGLRPGPLARRISADALPLISEELPAGSHKGICVQDVRLNSLEYWPLYQTPPLLRPLHAFEVGTSVIKDGRLGAIVTCKVDYLVQLDSGHRFTLEYGMEGVRPEPRQGFPMDPYGMFPTQRVYVKGEWLRNFQEQLRRRRRDRGRSTEEPSPEVAAAENAHRLCRGFVKSFAVRSVKVNWLLDAYESWSADPSYPIATSQPSEHGCSELLPIQQFVLRLGQPVYLNTRHQSSAVFPSLSRGTLFCESSSDTKIGRRCRSPDRAKEDPCALKNDTVRESDGGEAGSTVQGEEASSVVTQGGTRLDERGGDKEEEDKQTSPLYRLGIVSSLSTKCSVLWEDGSVAESVSGQAMTPVNVDRVPLPQSEYIVNVAILPHMYVTRKWTQEELDKLAEEEERAELAARAHGPPWWNTPHFGEVELSEKTEIPQDLKAVEAVRALTRVCREVGLADESPAGLPEGGGAEAERAPAVGAEADADSGVRTEEERGRRRRRRRSLLRRRGPLGGRESSSRGSGGEARRADRTMSDDDDEDCWEDCLESDQEPDTEFQGGEPTEGMAEEGGFRGNGGNAPTPPSDVKSSSASGSSLERGGKTSPSGLVAGIAGGDADHRLQEIFKCLQETVGPGNISLPLYKRIPVLRGGPRYCSSATPWSASPEHQSCRVSARPGNEARSADAGRCSTSTPRTSALPRTNEFKDRLPSQTGENGRSTPATGGGEDEESSSHSRETGVSVEPSEDDMEEAPARLTSLVGNMVRGEVRRRELLQLVEFLRMAGSGGAAVSSSTCSASLEDTSCSSNSTSTPSPQPSSASTRGRLDPVQIQGVVSCLMALRGGGGGCLPFSARGTGYRRAQEDDARGGGFKEDTRGLGVVITVKREERKATVGWIENPREFFLRARRLREEMAASDGDAAQVLKDRTQEKAVERQLARFGIAMWAQGKQCQSSQSRAEEERGAFYRQAAAEYFEGGLVAGSLRLEDVPLSELSPVSRFLFFPGDCALLLEPQKASREEERSFPTMPRESGKDGPGPEVPDRTGSQGAANGALDAGVRPSQEQTDKDKKVYLEVMAACGGLVWCRTLDGRLAPFAPDELVPLNTRWCDMEPSYEDSSEDESEYSDTDSESSSEGDWNDEGESDFGSTNVTDLSDSSRGPSRCSSPGRMSDPPSQTGPGSGPLSHSVPPAHV